MEDLSDIELLLFRFLNDINNMNVEYTDPEIMATYYLPLFALEHRTDTFKNLLKECFGDESILCDEMPRPLMCINCLNKFIKKCNLTNDVYKNIILPRFLELKDYMLMLTEHSIASNEAINIDTLFDLLSIDMTIYDPPSISILNQCEIIKYCKKEEDDRCVICMCDFEEEEPVKKLICSHYFHEACIMKWFEAHSTCPICKKSLKEI